MIDPVDPATQEKKVRSLVTGSGGKFTIEFDELDRDLDRDNEQPVRIRFSKTTKVGDDGKVIKHKFLCQGGEVDCTETGTIVPLKHLTFGQPLDIYDATTVPVKGTVTIMESGGCPLITKAAPCGQQTSARTCGKKST